MMTPTADRVRVRISEMGVDVRDVRSVTAAVARLVGPGEWSEHVVRAVAARQATDWFESSFTAADGRRWVAAFPMVGALVDAALARRTCATTILVAAVADRIASEDHRARLSAQLVGPVGEDE